MYKRQVLRKVKLYLLYLLLGIIPSELVAAAEKKVWFFCEPADKLMELEYTAPVDVYKRQAYYGGVG